MQIIRTTRILPALVLALVALFVTATGSALAASGSHDAPGAATAHKRKPRKPKPKPKPKPPRGPFVSKDASATGIGTGPDDTVVLSLNVPRGRWIVTAKAELGNNAASANSVTCKLLEGFNPLDSGTEALTPLAMFSRTLTLTSSSEGGSIKLACTADNPAQARNRVITAVRA